MHIDEYLTEEIMKNILNEIFKGSTEKDKGSPDSNELYERTWSSSIETNNFAIGEGRGGGKREHGHGDFGVHDTGRRKQLHLRALGAAPACTAPDEACRCQRPVDRSNSQSWSLTAVSPALVSTPAKLISQSPTTVVEASSPPGGAGSAVPSGRRLP